jgi:hypothetical protein
MPKKDEESSKELFETWVLEILFLP